MSSPSFFQRHKIKIVSVVFIALFFFAYFFNAMFVYVYPGEKGVLFQALADSSVIDEEFDEGLYFIAPWNRMVKFDTTLQKHSTQVQALTSSGLRVMLRVSAVFHPDPERLSELATQIGKDYVDKIIVPMLHSSVRETIGDYLPENLYTTARNVIQETILKEARRELEGRPFVIEDIVVEELKLPDSINIAIENKLKHQQDALAYTYILEQEVAEASRRRIEAKSIKLYQAEVGSNLNEQILRWLEIKALADLSKSSNSKIVVMGANAGEAPLVLPMDISEAQKSVFELLAPKQATQKEPEEKMSADN